MSASFHSLTASAAEICATSRQVHNEAGRNLDVSRLCASAASCPTRSEHARTHPVDMLATTASPTLPTELIFNIVGCSLGQHYHELVTSPKSIPAGWEPGSVFMQTSRTFRVCTRRFLKPLWGKQMKQGVKSDYKKTMALLLRLAEHVHGVGLDDLVKEEQPTWLKERVLRSPSTPLVFILKGLFCYTARSRIWPSKSHWEKWEAHVPPMLEHTDVMIRMAESYRKLSPWSKATALGSLGSHIRDTVGPWTVAFTRAYILRHLVETLISQFVEKGDLPQDVYILTMVDALDDKSLEHSKILAREVKTSCDTDMRMFVSAFSLSPACAEPNVVTDPTWRFPSEDWKVVSDSLRIWKNLPVAEEKVNAGRELWQTICMLMSPADRKFLRIPDA